MRNTVIMSARLHHSDGSVCLCQGLSSAGRPDYLVGLKTHPAFDQLRDNPRFIRLLDEMTFDEYKKE